MREIFEEARLRLQAEKDYENKELLKIVKLRLEHEPLSSNVLFMLTQCNQPKPMTTGYLWWKKHKCPCCVSPVKLTEMEVPGTRYTSVYTMSSCNCGWVWANEETY